MSYSEQIILAVLSVSLLGLIGIKSYIKTPTVNSTEQSYDRFLLE